MKKPWSVPYLLSKAVFLLSVLLAGAVEAATDTFTASGTWTAPAGVTSVTVEAWGGGGAGGGATSNTGPFKGGGGAGGQYAKKVVAVTPLAVYSIAVGAGGAGSTGSGTAGGDSTFGAAQVVAKGGAGGISYELGFGAGLGSAAGGVGDTVYKGGDGSAGGATDVGGAGGGGAGSTGAGGTGAGGNASGNVAGTGTASGGGNGAAGLTATGDGTAGFVAGGGGSGGYVTSNSNRSGGGGAAGTVTISYAYASAPTVTTTAATSLTATGATLNGTVSSNGAATTVTFDYGLTTGYGSSATAAQSPLDAGASNAAVSAAVTGLACNTLYHFRVKGVNIAGTTNGSDGTFTTAACIPTATTNAASGVTFAAATLNGTVSSNGASTTVSFEYGLTAAYGYSLETQYTVSSPLSANEVNTAVSAQVIGLNCNTVFHYRVKAMSSAGTTYGFDSTFTTGDCTAAYSQTACAATRFGSNLGCTANDVNITGITLATVPVQQSSCVSGTPVTLDLDLTVNFASPDRWDIGIFIANDGKLPTLLPANGGASSCSVAVLPIAFETGSDVFLNLDGAATTPPDTCGDGNKSLVPVSPTPTGSGIKRMTGVTMPCYASPDSLGKLFVPFVVSWDNQKSPIGGTCTSNQYPVPNTTSKCNAPLSSVPINVVVMPKINKTHSGASFNSGDTIIYTITVFNDSGGTLQASFFKDPAVSGLAVTGLLCTPANGAACPIANNTVDDMQGPGIPIPSANLPNNSSLIFTVTGTLTGSIGTTISNTATVSIGLNTNSSTDSVTLGAASGSKSFAPNSITEDNNSLMTITFTNPTASAVTGVSFLDTYPAGLVNAASPGESTTCGGTPVATTGGNTLTFSGGTIPANGSCTVSVYVTSAAANSYINSVSFTPGSPGSLGSASATLNVSAPVFGAFNACDDATDPNAICTSATTSTNSRIATKIAGVPFTLDLVALNSNGSWNPSYSSAVTVELLDASDNSGARDAYNCRSTWAPIIATLAPNPSFASSNGQITTVGSFTVQEAYRNVRVRVTNVGGSFKRGCSTDNFAIRPNSLTVTPTDLTWVTAGTANSLTNTNVSGGVVHKAGQPIDGVVPAKNPFTVTATAKNASNVTTANYNLTVNPTVLLSNCSPATACTASFGTFALGAAAVMSGVVTWDSATYSEVGAFNLTLQDTDFASVDAADTAASCAGRYVCGTTPVGRFVPDHFGITGSVVTRSDLQTTEGQATPFTYMDEPMKLSLVVTAYNANDVKTNNYAGNFAKLDAATLGTGSNWFNTGCTGSTQCMGLGAVNGATGLSSRLLVVGASTYASVGDPSSSWSAGVGTFTAHVKLARKTSAEDWPDPPNSLLDGPYDTLKFGGMPKDSDGVTLPGPASSDTHKVDLNATTGDMLASNPDEIDERKEIFQTAARFGRLWLGNACGSDKRDLTIPFRAEYWNGSVFITNTHDDSTSIAKANIGLGNHQPAAGGIWAAGFDASVDRTHIPTTPPLLSVAKGVGSFSLALPTPTGAPSPPAGSVDIVFALGSTTDGFTTATNTSFDFSTAQPPTVGANMPYLLGKWYGAAYDHDPVARAAFGIYCGGGSGRGPIYIRESY